MKVPYVGFSQKKKTILKNSLLIKKKKKTHNKATFKKQGLWTPLVVQWLRIRLPKQGTRVRALAGQDPTCRGTTKPMSHNY